MYMFLRQEDKVICALDIGTASIKAVSITRSGEALSLNNYNEVYTAGYSGKEMGEYSRLGYEELGKVITDSYNELGTKANRLVLGLPVSECIFKTISLPVSVVNMPDISNIENILKLEFAKKVFAINILNYKFTFSKIDEDRQRISYLVLAINQEYINKLNKIAASICDDYAIEPNIFGGIRMLPQENDQNTLLINIGANNINLAFINQGVLVGVENIDKGINQVIFNVKNSTLTTYREARVKVFDFDYLNEEDPVLSDTIKLSTVSIINDIVSVLNSYELRYNIKYNKVYLSGSSVKISNTKIFYSQHLNRPVEVLKPFDRLSLPIVMQESIAKDSAVFVNSLGLAINHIN